MDSVEAAEFVWSRGDVCSTSEAADRDYQIAVGGTTVTFDWNPDAPDKGQKLSPRTLRLIRESLAQLGQRGVRNRLDGVMWHQGENDLLDRNLYKLYADGLRNSCNRVETASGMAAS